MFAFAEDRNRALRKWAEGDLHCMAAVELLIDHGYWPRMLDEAGMLDVSGSGDRQMARPKYNLAIRALENRGEERRYAFETASSSERDVLYIAASLAVGHKINLSKHLQSFDRNNSRRVARAIGIATRQVQV